VKASPIVSFILGLSILTALAACQSAAPTATPAPTVDTAATVSAAVQATSAAQASFAATVDAAVKATSAAQTTPTRAAASTQPAATPKPSGATATPAASYTTMTEEEMAALIDQAVKEAVTATTTASTTTTSATSDGTVSSGEAQTINVNVSLATEEIAQALALMQGYYGLYYDLAVETLALLQALEQDLNSMSQSLVQITQILAQGQVNTQAAISQLQAAATKANTTAVNAQAKEKNLTKTLQTELDKRATTALAAKPTNVPADLKATGQSVSTYIETVRSALGDKVTKSELSAISLAGANAVAGLSKNGGTQFQGLATSINNTTKQVARGELPKAKSSLGALEQSAKSLPSMPSVPSVPGKLPEPPKPWR